MPIKPYKKIQSPKNVIACRRQRHRNEENCEEIHYIINDSQRPIFGWFAGSVIAASISICVALLSNLVTTNSQEKYKKGELIREESSRVAKEAISTIDQCYNAVIEFDDMVSKGTPSFQVVFETHRKKMQECKAKFDIVYFDVKRYFGDDAASVIRHPEQAVLEGTPDGLRAHDFYGLMDLTTRMVIVRRNAGADVKREKSSVFDETPSRKLVSVSESVISEYIDTMDRQRIAIMKVFSSRLTALGTPEVRFNLK